MTARKYKFLQPPRPLPHTNIHIHHHLSRTAAAATTTATTTATTRMQRSARASALPSVEVKFWTADASGQEEIKEFLTNEIAGKPRLVFYASFLNWCNKHVQKLGDPRAKYQNDGAKVEAEALRDTLRKQPLDIREFIGLMARYFRGPWKGGMQSGPIVEVHDPSKLIRKHFLVYIHELISAEQRRETSWKETQSSAQICGARTSASR